MANRKDGYTDAEFVDGVKNANHEIFSSFYSRNFQRFAWLATKYVKDIHAAEEIVQDLFLRFWENPDGLDGVRSIQPYLYRTIINESINYINRQKNIAGHHLRVAEELSDEYIEMIVEDFALKELLHKEIERLPAQCKKVFRMSRIENLKYREIAEALGISEKTVENHIVNALKILRARLLSENEEVKRIPGGEAKMLLLLLSLGIQ